LVKPLIGIIGKVQPQYGEDIWHRIDEVDEIRYLIVKNGGTAITLLAPRENVEGYAKISSFSKEGLVESIELENKKFIIGVKWHPELMLEDEFPTKLFKKFIEISGMLRKVA